MSKQKSTQKLTWKTILGAVIAVVLLLVGNHFGLLPDSDGGSSSSGRTGAIIAPQDIADYLFDHGKLPENFITKREAEKLGWDSGENYVSDVAPGKSIGGDRFGNYEGLLPDKGGRTWYEADANYVSGPRGAERIVFSSDGLVYYTRDHYESFTQMQPSD